MSRQRTAPVLRGCACILLCGLLAGCNSDNPLLGKWKLIAMQPSDAAVQAINGCMMFGDDHILTEVGDRLYRMRVARYAVSDRGSTVTVWIDSTGNTRISEVFHVSDGGETMRVTRTVGAHQITQIFERVPWLSAPCLAGATTTLDRRQNIR